MRVLGKWQRFATLIIGAIAVLVFVSACTTEETGVTNRENAVESREDNFARATQRYPAPTNLTNFPLRKALVEFTQRQDEIKPWYIYILGMNGDYVGYFVGQTYPVNACNFLSSSERFENGQKVTAPSYDGIFYGGGGSSSNCDSYFFFDQTTNAIHTFKAPMWFATDQPLNLDVRLITNTADEEDVPSPEPTPQVETATTAETS